MPSLIVQIDRLTQTMKAVKASASALKASSSHSPAGPFTQAVLTTPLGDLIRDIDPSELGLFTLASPSAPTMPRDAAPVGPAPEITRIEVTSATPLRKYPSVPRRDMIVQPKEPDPEVFAKAALKYIDRYAGIRPMPRVRSQAASMLEHLHQIREDMQSLNENLRNMELATQPPGTLSPKSQAAEEERNIRDIQARIGQLQKRKVALQTKRSAPKVEARPPDSPELPKSVTSDPLEDTFWATPSAPRTMLFKGKLLMDEDLDVGNMTSPFSSPAAPFKPSGSTHASYHEQEPPDDEMLHDDSGALEDTFDRAARPSEDVEDAVEVDELTVVLEHPPSEALSHSSPTAEGEPSTPSTSTKRSSPPPADTTDPHAYPNKKIRITNDVERIVAKIWATVGDLVMPGNPFNVSGNGAPRPPRAKETIAHLHSLAEQSPLPGSPTASSLSSAPSASSQPPTSQQVLTAQMLIALLEAAPQFSLPLGKLKAILSSREKSEAHGFGGSATTRVLYGCVAKRLVRIDRGGGEQIVRFDV
ncbi:hypothetical protein BC834DRAFT_653438 [Gloeopeniophorella convolvens]|nr:hypothetical protein BC834DRAFT_653438 [Gloeopeniophorella convolvens]